MCIYFIQGIYANFPISTEYNSDVKQAENCIEMESKKYTFSISIIKTLVNRSQVNVSRSQVNTHLKSIILRK